MTAKQAVFAAYRSGNVNLAALREEYRSIQVRKVGKDITQIRFRDSESWMTVEDFASNYLNKILKDLSDQLTSASKVLSPKELLNGLTDDCRRSVMQSGVKYALANNLAVDIDEYNKLVNEYNQEHTAKVNLANQLNNVSTELSECRQRLEENKRRQQTREANLQQMKREILDSATMGMMKRAVVEQKFNDYSV
jgi:hypothetical protein